MRQTILLKAAFDAKQHLTQRGYNLYKTYLSVQVVPFDDSILQDASKMADLPASPSTDAVTPRLAHA